MAPRYCWMVHPPPPSPVPGLGGPGQEEIIVEVEQVVSSRIPVEVLGVLADYYSFFEFDYPVSPIMLSPHHAGTVPNNHMICFAHMIRDGRLVFLSLCLFPCLSCEYSVLYCIVNILDVLFHSNCQVALGLTHIATLIPSGT